MAINAAFDFPSSRTTIQFRDKTLAGMTQVPIETLRVKEDSCLLGTQNADGSPTSQNQVRNMILVGLLKAVSLNLKDMSLVLSILLPNPLPSFENNHLT